MTLYLLGENKRRVEDHGMIGRQQVADFEPFESDRDCRFRCRYRIQRSLYSRGGRVQSDDFLLLELLSDFDDLSVDLLSELDLLDDSLAFLSAAAPLL